MTSFDRYYVKSIDRHIYLSMLFPMIFLGAIFLQSSAVENLCISFITQRLGNINRLAYVCILQHLK